MEIRINKIYKLQKKIGSGSFGQIFQVVNLKTNELLAVKLEPLDTQSPQLAFESRLYSLLSNDRQCVGIPKVYFSGQEGEFTVMVMDLLGHSLEELFLAQNKRFDLKTVCQLGDQMIQRVQYLHSKGFLHRDIKPDNFLMKDRMVYMVDFGLAKKFQLKNKVHIPYKENKNLTGTARYASRNTHLGVEQSRRDDLESIGYVLVYFLKGALPWQNQKGANRNEKYEKIKQKKLATPFEVLCLGLPSQFQLYLQYCANIRFEDQPDYAYLRGLLKEVMQQNNYAWDSRYCFDQDSKICDTMQSIQRIEGKQEAKREPNPEEQLRRLQHQEERLINYVQKKAQRLNQPLQSEYTTQNRTAVPSFVKKSPMTNRQAHRQQEQEKGEGYSGPKIVKYR